MRALILLLSGAVLLLAALILVRRPGQAREAPLFDATRLIADARRGETATYRDELGNTVTWIVDGAIPGGADREPVIRLTVLHRDRLGAPVPGGTSHYDHRPARHGLFPLMAPADPQGYDRLWVWERIRRSTLLWRGQDRLAWRFDLFDPALPPEGGQDHVVAWLDPDVPVFGLVQFQRAGRTWELTEWGPR